jgi:hypothetical protein
MESEDRPAAQAQRMMQMRMQMAAVFMKFL